MNANAIGVARNKTGNRKIDGLRGIGKMMSIARAVRRITAIGAATKISNVAEPRKCADAKAVKDMEVVKECSKAEAGIGNARTGVPPASARTGVRNGRITVATGGKADKAKGSNGKADNKWAAAGKATAVGKSAAVDMRLNRVAANGVNVAVHNVRPMAWAA